MAYELLSKLYYVDEEAQKMVYTQRFLATSTIKLDFSPSHHPLFFTQNEDVIWLVSQILRSDKKIAEWRRILPGVAMTQYSRKCLIDEIVLTNSIEGIHSSRKEIGTVLNELSSQSKERGKKKRFDGIVKKYYKLLNREVVALSTCEDIRSLYDEIVLDEVIEEDPSQTPDGRIFRKDQADVHNAADKVIHSGVYPEDAIISSMNSALSFLNNPDVEVLYRISIFHYLLEYIHPFYDGNGRLGRFIVSYKLSQEMEPLLAYRISEMIKENIKDYYKAFDICNDKNNLGDLTPFLIMMLTMIRNSAEDLNQSLARRYTQLIRYTDIIPYLPNADQKDMARLYDYLIQATLFAETGISTGELINYLELSFDTVKKRIKQIDENLLVTTMESHQKYYKLDIEKLDHIRSTLYGQAQGNIPT